MIIFTLDPPLVNAFGTRLSLTITDTWAFFHRMLLSLLGMCELVLVNFHHGLLMPPFFVSCNRGLFLAIVLSKFLFMCGSSHSLWFYLPLLGHLLGHFLSRGSMLWVSLPFLLQGTKLQTPLALVELCLLPLVFFFIVLFISRWIFLPIFHYSLLALNGLSSLALSMCSFCLNKSSFSSLELSLFFGGFFAPWSCHYSNNHHYHCHHFHYLLCLHRWVVVITHTTRDIALASTPGFVFLNPLNSCWCLISGWYLKIPI